ncbi:MAG: PDZ domain-containing protein [Candidatus Marinimicrobia bacterium]|nr:PDZ domain-containing protein [Candidatus Neomarinimicrobiota bacterium]
MKITKIILILILGCSTISARIPRPQIIYQLSMPEPHTHYFHVELTIEDNADSLLILKMPVWTPGSYLIREFSRHIPRVNASANNKPLSVKKTAKNEWTVKTGKHQTIIIQYKIYAFEQSVRTSFLNSSRGYVNGASVFLYVEGRENEPGILKIRPFKQWHTISTGLPKVRGKRRTYEFPDYDILIDSPILIGNHKVLEFTVDDIPHEIAVFGQGNMDEKILITDFKTIVESSRDIFGSLPYNRYVFLLLLLEKGRGGLEHLNSTTIEINRWIFTDENKYKDFLTLVSHEFFHTWNVKRIRPIALGPFDYDKENYTEDLWISEGITSYFEHLILLHGEIFTDYDFLEYLGKDIKTVETTPGRKVQSLTESSYDTWIKFYRKDENSPNTQISYYSKGSLVGMILDLAILENTKGEKSLIDVFRALYTNIYEKENRGFTSAEFKEICESIAGRKLDDIWKYVSGTEEIDYNTYLHPFGCVLEPGYSDGMTDSTAYFGFRMTLHEEYVVVKNVYDGFPAYLGGLNVHDEIIAIDDIRINNNMLIPQLREKSIGKPVKFLISRDGNIQTIDLTPISAPFNSFTLKKLDDATEQQKMLYQKWTRTPWEE